MTKFSNSDKQPKPGSNLRLQFFLLSRTSIALGVLTLLVGVAGGAWWLWIFVYEQLAPLVETNLTQTLNRPVQLGRVEQFSLTGLRFGASSVPATPTDPDRVSVDAVDVAFNLLQLVFTRTLELDVTLVNPDVYVEQDKNGVWISNTLAAEDRSGLIKTNLDTIRFRNADVVLVPNKEASQERRRSVEITQVNGAGQFLENNQIFRFYLDGQPVTGGTLALQGETRLKTLQTNLQLQAQNLLAPVVTRLVELPFELQAGRVDGNLKIQLTPRSVQSIFGTADLKAVKAAIIQLPQPFINSHGKLRFQGTQATLDNVQTSYGKIPLIANGVIDRETGYNVSAHVKAVSLANAQQTLRIELPVPVTGEATADAQLTGPIFKPILSGTVATTKPARIDQVNFSTIRTRFAFSTAASEIAFKDIQATPTVGGQITGAGKIQIEQKVGTQNFELGFDVIAKRLPGDAIARIYGFSPPIQVGNIEAIAKISGTAANPKTVVNWQAREATYPAQGKLIIAGTNSLLLRNTVVNVAGGTAQAAGQLADGRWTARVEANGVEIRRLAQVPPQIQGRLTGTFNLSGTASFQPETLRADGRGRITGIAGGTVTASNIQLQRGRWQALVNASQVQLARFSEQLRGQFSGQLRLAGTLDSFTPAAIRAAGGVRFSQGLGLIQQPLTATVSWDGEKVIVQRATTPSLSASGLIFARVSGASAPEITELNLNVTAQNYNLQDLPFSLPNTVNLAGRADFSGRVTGTLPTPNVAGSLRLRDLVVNNLAFEPLLTGDVQLAAGRGVELEVTGAQDRIALNLNSNYRPTSFLIRHAGAVANGQAQGENLLVNVLNFPLTALNFTPPNTALGSGPVAGLLTGDFEINPETFTVAGNVAIAQPAIGRIKGDSFVGQFRYDKGVATLTDGEFKLFESRYALRGTITQTPNGPQLQGQVNITQGQVQDVLNALQLFNLQDFKRGLQPPTYARAADLNTVSVGLPETSLLTQLRRFSEIEALLEQQKRRDASPLPSLANLQGTFGGGISLSGSLQTGVEVNFDLEGKNWEWGSYTANQIIAQGSFKNGVLTLLPLRIESDKTLVAFNGQVGGAQQSGQLRVRNFPVDMLNNFVNLRVDVTGQLNATATLAGSLQNPQALGELQLTEGTLNQKPVKSARASFSYSNARLNFGSNVIVSGPDPIAITGSVPTQLPLATVPPDSNKISLNVNVQNEELALLNLLTNSFAWEGGQGQVQLQVGGTIEQPVATGIATVNNATISAQALPEPLTGVTGTVRFTGNRISVESVEGKFSRGNVVAQGVIPIFASLEPDDPDRGNPLTVNLDQLALNLKELYQGGASGNVVITGSALNPIIGGEVRLDQGQVILPSGAGVPTASPAPEASPALSPGDGTVPEFNNLRLTLGDRIEITSPPLLNFQATGTLTLNGNRNDLRPDGTIRLLSGGVNLFTTQFVLARGNENTATFSPNQGLDPNLDIELVARVPEVTQRRVPDLPLSAEINQPLSTELGAFETVRVQATITGSASKLFDNLELTSNPSRSETEIIALLGGGFVNTLGRGDSTLGFANLAGSALLGNFQGTFTNIGNAFGLSELRLFPTVVTSERSRSSSTLGLAVEAGIDISGKVSISVLRVLTADQPTQFGLSYRVNNSFRIRTSTDFSGESRAVVEYENRF